MGSRFKSIDECRSIHRYHLEQVCYRRPQGAPRSASLQVVDDRFQVLMPTRIPIAWFVVALAAFAVGCRGNSLSSVDVPDQLVLYSIDGRDFVSNQLEKPVTNESFHEYPVLGKMEIEDRTAKREIIRAVKDGVRQSDGTLAKCYWPRDGIPNEPGHVSLSPASGQWAVASAAWHGRTHRIHRDRAAPLRGT